MTEHRTLADVSKVDLIDMVECYGTAIGHLSSLMRVQLDEKRVLKTTNKALVEELEKTTSYLADLNGSEWITGDGPGEIDMRQRAKILQKTSYTALKAAKGES